MCTSSWLRRAVFRFKSTICCVQSLELCKSIFFLARRMTPWIWKQKHDSKKYKQRAQKRTRRKHFFVNNRRGPTTRNVVVDAVGTAVQFDVRRGRTDKPNTVFGRPACRFLRCGEFRPQWDVKTKSVRLRVFTCGRGVGKQTYRTKVRTRALFK